MPLHLWSVLSNTEAYCEKLKNLRLVIQNKRYGMLIKGVLLLYDSAKPHTAACTQNLGDSILWDEIDHHP